MYNEKWVRKTNKSNNDSKQSYLQNATTIKQAYVSRRITDFLKYFRVTKNSCLVNTGLLPNVPNMCYGLLSVREPRYSPTDLVANEKYIPESWSRNKSAGEKWMKLFRERHNINLQTPETTNLSHATSFNKHNAGLFFNNIRHMIEKYGFNPNHIYNCDEFAVTTTHRPPKIMAPCGQKQVSKVISAKRGVFFTM